VKAPTIGLVALLVSSLAFGQEVAVPSDAPVMATVKSGTAQVTIEGQDVLVSLPSGTFINDLGMSRLNKTFKALQIDLIEAKAQNETLRTRVDEIAADPPLNLKAVLLIAGGALLVGAGVGAGVAVAVTNTKGK
jgi:hypothetical protein